MNDDALNKRFDTIERLIETFVKTIADQHLLTIRMMSHQQAHLAAIRDLMVRGGEDRAILNQKLRNSYETAVNLFHAQLEAYYESKDAKKFVESLVFPDDLQSN